MRTLADLLVFLVAALHVGFLILEMFLWKKPLGLKILRNSPEKAEITAVLAANQGLYNGFLAAGLLCALFSPEPEVGFAFRIFFLGCVMLAGVYGAWSVNRRIFWVQAFPAMLALGLSWFA